MNTDLGRRTSRWNTTIFSKTRSNIVKLELDIDGKTLAVEFNFTGGTAQLKQADQIYEAQVSEPEPDLFVVLLNGHVYRCAFERGGTEVIVNGQRFPYATRSICAAVPAAALAQPAKPA
jgi:hypothetical protein